MCVYMYLNLCVSLETCVCNELLLCVREKAKAIAKCHTSSWQDAYAKMMTQDYLYNKLPGEHESQWTKVTSCVCCCAAHVFSDDGV